MLSDETLKNEITTTLKLNFQVLTSPRIKLICRPEFSSLPRDFNFQSFEHFFGFRHKIKFAKCWFDSEKACICFFFFFFFFFLFSISLTGFESKVKISRV